MHGLIVNQLQRFLVTRYGRATWAHAASSSAARDAGVLGDSVPAIDKIYPDALVFALVAGAVERTGVEARTLLREFGAFLAPALLRVYEPLVQPQWRTLDIIEHTEERIHTAVRLRDPSAGPPYLSATRVSGDEVHIAYTSARRLCAVAEGIAEGIAHRFGETLRIAQPECMHRGAARGLITVQRVR